MTSCGVERMFFSSYKTSSTFAVCSRPTAVGYPPTAISYLQPLPGTLQPLFHCAPKKGAGYWAPIFFNSKTPANLYRGWATHPCHIRAQH